MNNALNTCAEVVLDVTGALKLVSVIPSVMELSHTRAVDEIFDYFEVKENVGLNESQINTARQTYGLNGEFLREIQSRM